MGGRKSKKALVGSNDKPQRSQITKKRKQTDENDPSMILRLNMDAINNAASREIAKQARMKNAVHRTSVNSSVGNVTSAHKTVDLESDHTISVDLFSVNATEHCPQSVVIHKSNTGETQSLGPVGSSKSKSLNQSNATTLASNCALNSMQSSTDNPSSVEPGAPECTATPTTTGAKQVGTVLRGGKVIQSGRNLSKSKKFRKAAMPKDGQRDPDHGKLKRILRNTTSKYNNSSNKTMADISKLTIPSSISPLVSGTSIATTSSTSGSTVIQSTSSGRGRTNRKATKVTVATAKQQQSTVNETESSMTIAKRKATHQAKSLTKKHKQNTTVPQRIQAVNHCPPPPTTIVTASPVATLTYPPLQLPRFAPGSDQVMINSYKDVLRQFHHEITLLGGGHEFISIKKRGEVMERLSNLRLVREEDKMEKNGRKRVEVFIIGWWRVSSTCKNEIADARQDGRLKFYDYLFQIWALLVDVRNVVEQQWRLSLLDKNGPAPTVEILQRTYAVIQSKHSTVLFQEEPTTKKLGSIRLLNVKPFFRHDKVEEVHYAMSFLLILARQMFSENENLSTVLVD